MPISCHFRDCKALLVTSLTHVSGAIESVQTFTFTFNRLRIYMSVGKSTCSSWQYLGIYLPHVQLSSTIRKHVVVRMHSAWQSKNPNSWSTCTEFEQLSFSDKIAIQRLLLVTILQQLFSLTFTFIDIYNRVFHVNGLRLSSHSTPCSKKVSPLMFDNNFGKCGPIFKFFHQVIRKKILYVYITKISISPEMCCYTTL